ncbi:glutamyl-tRNA reductase [Natronobacterium gregoryi]|uniref:Glutamyl-tRNA reductase n=2 Tax=Natronobacterium gregoryi TaxID=44930 RepID=L0ALJ5_NATGS|nr:glutamyl-tRNA reductase [Natronobacterium gregoryi]AFZ74324.1 glutamyl-tRNA reductase [Natronobacterium gregoryi SP2]ELY63557.1 glutamyl-tRNA reductase [Natronobacterium gregoryi SP2]PLK22166.1 glutamyl-tRNA reductase [Natronobacterium gregoryi SP2]SFI53740.1 glutamyl-tRNA reductase [Natronobacterium gregoryi]
MTNAGVVTAARVTHDSGSVDDIAAASPESQRTAVTTLCSLPEIEEGYVLSTCNRVEAYAVANDSAVGQAALEEFFAGVDDDAVVQTGHRASLRHLLRVATGLESVVLGEDQIIGQVRDAYEDARSAGGIGPMLEAAVTKAIHVGERARTETEINEGVVSLGSAATKLASRELSLAGTTSLVVGAGEMGQLAARSLADAAVDELLLSNRTVSRARHLAAELETDAGEDVETRALPLESLSMVASSADVVVTATGSDDPVLGPGHLEDGDAKQVVVDLGQPRDVAPAANSLPNVTVYDLDDLESVTKETRRQRAEAAREVEVMVDEELELLQEQYKRARADEVIAAMYESANQIKDRELEKAFSRLEDDGLSDDQREVVESMADTVVNQLLAPPTRCLREAAAEDDWETINTALQLFDPHFGDEIEPLPFDGTPAGDVSLEADGD